MLRATRLGILLILALPLGVRADEKAEAVSREILAQGSALFDQRDSGKLAATYTIDARFTLVARDEKTTDVSLSVREGRAAIEELYLDLFKDKDKDRKTTSRNTVDHARLLAPDLLLIQGTFAPDADSPDSYPFVQIRVKKGDAWLIRDLQFFVIPRD